MEISQGLAHASENQYVERILFNGEKGYVRYRGKLLHKVDNTKIKADEEWIGVEWDDPTKGKHNGTVDGTVYFTCTNNLNAGSLVLAKKATFGQEILEAIIRRYFRDHEVNEILKHKSDIVNYLREKWLLDQQKYNGMYQNITNFSNLPTSTGSPSKDSAPTGTSSPSKDAFPVPGPALPPQDQETSPHPPASPQPRPSDDSMFEDDSDPTDMSEKNPTSTNRKQHRTDNVTSLLTKIKDRDCFTTKQVATEYDEDAVIRTFGKRTKKIEFKGFDKVWERIYHLDKVVEMSLAEQHIGHFGAVGGIGRIVSGLKNLSLEKNLLHDWAQVLVLGTELRQLEMLSISYNNLRFNPASYGTKLPSFNEQVEFKEVQDTAEVFPKLHKLIAIETGLTFEGVKAISPYMPKLEELVLCKNKCNDFHNLDVSSLKNLRRLNLEANSITDNHQVSKLQHLENLEELALNGNTLTRFPEGEKYLKLQALNLMHNAVADGGILEDLRGCPALVSLKIAHNPIEQGTDKKDLRRRAVAELPLLARINGMDLNRYERKDCEFYFLRWVFHEYFNRHGLHQLSYKFSDFEVWAKVHFPGVFRLISKYENPYPEVPATADDDDLRQQMAQANKLAAAGEEGNAPGARYIRLLFSAPIGPMSGKPPISKRFPPSTDFLYIRAWIASTFKIKNKESITIRFKNTHQGVYETIEDLNKTIEYYDLQNDADVIIEEK